MSQAIIVPVLTNEEIIKLSEVAREIWNEYFTFILSQDQIDYMLNKFLSPTVLIDQLDDGYEYYFLKDKDNILGFTVIHPEPEKMFLSKIYLYDENRNHGYSNIMFDKVEDRTKELGLNKIYLTVNKYNKNPINIYKHLGYKTVDSVVTDIGGGYIMDDFIMEKELS